MPSNYRASFFFESDQQGIIGTGASVGWTENWYYAGGSSLEGVYQSADVQTWMKLRLGFMSPLYRLSFVRISDEANPHSFKIFAPLNLTGSGVKIQAQSAQVQCAVLVDMMKLPSSGDSLSHHRRVLLRGLPSQLIDGNILDPGAPVYGQLIAFLNFIGQHDSAVPIAAGATTAQNLGIKYQPSGLVKTVLTGITAASDPRLIHVTPLIPAIPPAPPNPGVPAPVAGTRIRIQKVLDEKRINKLWTVLSVETGGYLLGKLKSILPSAYSYNLLGQAFMTIPSFAYSKVDQYTIIGLRSKRTGRVFRQLRGRSSSRL